MKLIVTVGLPRSGKSAWAKQQGLPMVNPDSIRLAMHGKKFEPLAVGMVWAICFIMIRALNIAGHETIIVDGTHINEHRRNTYKRQFPDAEIEFKVFHTSKEECVQRAKDSGTPDLIPIICLMDNEQDFRQVFSDNTLKGI